MDPLLLPFLHACNESERQVCLDEILVVHATPVVRQVIRRKLGLYVSQRGINPHNEHAEDLYQEIMTKVVQALQTLSKPTSKTNIENFRQYVARIASNACNDVLRAKSPARARLKNNLRFILGHHRDFAIWKREGETLCGFAEWRDNRKSSSSLRVFDLEDTLAHFSSRFPRHNVKQWPLTNVVSELFRSVDQPVELDALVNVVAALIEVKDHPVESVDDETVAYVEARISESTISATSRLEEQALLRSLWRALKELSKEQRYVFCFGFEDQSGRDLFSVLLEAEVVTFRDLEQELDRPIKKIVELWSKMPMDLESIAFELKISRAQVYKFRFRALQRLQKLLLPSSGAK
jgi:RNA polymerase sigma factor (sigma-70 family)